MPTRHNIPIMEDLSAAETDKNALIYSTVNILHWKITPLVGYISWSIKCLPINQNKHSAYHSPLLNGGCSDFAIILSNEQNKQMNSSGLPVIV